MEQTIWECCRLHIQEKVAHEDGLFDDAHASQTVSFPGDDDSCSNFGIESYGRSESNYSTRPTMEPPSLTPTNSPETASPMAACLVQLPPPSSPLACQPTSNTCVATSSALLEAVERGDGVVAICGDTTIETSSAIRFTMSSSGSDGSSSLTLCCETQNCVLQSSGSDRNLYITGRDDSEKLLLSNIVFRGGRLPEEFGPVGRGGNVYIEIPEQNTAMQIIAEDCLFDDGAAFEGGNLYINNSFGQVILRRSILSNGAAFAAGGGAYIAAVNILIQESDFMENQIDNSEFGLGGGLVTDYMNAEIGQEIAIYNSTFFQNLALSAGGIFASSFGTLSSLTIQLTTFEDNRAVCLDE